MLSDEWLPRYRLLENFTAKWNGNGNGNGNAYDRGDYNSSFALRAVELKRGECRCRGLDLTQNHLKMEKKRKKKKKREKKIVFGAGFEPTTLRLQILHLTC